MELSWFPPANSTLVVAGYEVFYAESGSDATAIGGNTTNTTISVKLPELGVTYDLFVVAFSDANNALPSARSSNITIDLSEFEYL